MVHPLGQRPIDPGAVLHYADPVGYDERYVNRTDDVAYYVRACQRARGEVLEYGCGTGRLTLPIARAGVPVTGVDLSLMMLDRLRVKLSEADARVRKRVTLHHGDMRTIRLRRRFALVIVPFNTFQHLYTRSDVEAFLASARRHLNPGSRLLLDVYLPHMTELDGKGFDSTYDPLRQILRMRFAGDGTDQLALRQFFPREIEMLLLYNGFERVRLTADFTRAPLHGEATSMVVQCTSVPALAEGRGTKGPHGPPKKRQSV